MPLDTTTAPFDPFAAAGFTKGADGSYSAPVGPLPTQAAPAAPAAAPAAPAATTTGVVPVIDVGPPAGPTPQPGEMGSQFRPVQVAPTARAGTSMPAQAVPPQPAPPPQVAPAPGPGVAAVPVQQPPPAPAVAPPAQAPAFDPFTEGGFVKGPGGYQLPGQPAQPAAQPAQAQPTKLPPAPPVSTSGHSASNEPWYQNMWDTAKAIDSTFAGMTDSAAHAFTLGFDQDVSAFLPALIHSYANNVPFGQAFEQTKAQMNAQRNAEEEAHPVATGTASLIGGVASAAPDILGGMFTAAKGVVPFIRNVAAGTALGGLTGFGESEGDFSQRVEDARKAEEWGAGLSVGIPWLAKAIGGVYRSVRPTAQRIATKAGQILTEMAGGRTPPFQRAPIPDFPLGTGSATNEARLAAAERRADSLDDPTAVARRTAQQQAVRQAATTAQPTGTQLARGVMDAGTASTRLTQGFRRAQAVIKQEEDRLWSTPNLQSRPLDITGMKRDVYSAGTRMPLRFQRVIQRTPEMKDILEDFFKLPNHATLLDINDIRSDLLAVGRTAVDPFARRVANRMADNLLKAIERDPNIRGNPAAWADYLKARNFTYQKWQTVGQKPFQNVIKQGADERAAGRSLFGFGGARGAGTIGERVPGGISDVTDMLDNIRQQWTALGHAGFDPATASAAGEELAQSARDYIINAMIHPVERSTTGATAGQLNQLQQWVNTNRGWLVGSRIFAPEQLDLIDAIRESAEMGARVANLRGGTGSETFERLMGGRNPQIINLFSTALNKHLFFLGSGVLSSWLGHFGDVGLAIMIGMGLEGGGKVALERLYQIPTEKLRQRLIEAAGDPDIARNLMRRASDAKNFSDKTLQWLKALGAEAGAYAERQNEPQPVQ